MSREIKSPRQRAHDPLPAIRVYRFLLRDGTIGTITMTCGLVAARNTLRANCTAELLALVEMNSPGCTLLIGKQQRKEAVNG